MRQVVVEQFGGIENLKLVEVATPEPGPGQVRVRITSIGMNHADLMARRGEYRLSSGDPPFTPGLEAGGVIEALGPGVGDRSIGQRVSLGADVPRLSAGGMGGTYRSHYVCPAAGTVLVPDAVPDEQLGALWLPYLTAWGCLVWKERIRPGQFIAMPAASSSVALAAAQIAKQHGCVTLGLTTSPGKVEQIRKLPGCAYDHLVLTKAPDGNPAPWYKDIKRITGDHGVDVFFDPVAAGGYLESEIRTLAQRGTIYVYGLLGEAGKVDVSPLIRKWASIRGWVLNEIVSAGPETLAQAYREILAGFERGAYRQHVDKVFTLDQVREAQAYMDEGRHIGKLVLTP